MSLQMLFNPDYTLNSNVYGLQQLVKIGNFHNEGNAFIGDGDHTIDNIHATYGSQTTFGTSTPTPAPVVNPACTIDEARNRFGPNRC